MINGTIETDFWVKPTVSHHDLNSSSCHTYQCKKNISHSQALRLIRICSKNDSFDIHCDNLEKLLNERRYSKS